MGVDPPPTSRVGSTPLHLRRLQRFCPSRRTAAILDCGHAQFCLTCLREYVEQASRRSPSVRRSLAAFLRLVSLLLILVRRPTFPGCCSWEGHTSEGLGGTFPLYPSSLHANFGPPDVGFRPFAHGRQNAELNMQTWPPPLPHKVDPWLYLQSWLMARAKRLGEGGEANRHQRRTGNLRPKYGRTN